MGSNHSKQFLKSLTSLIEEYPTQSIGKHLSFIFDGYSLSDLDNIPAKELVFLIEKYKSEKDLEQSFSYQDPTDIVLGIENPDIMYEEDEEI